MEVKAVSTLWEYFYSRLLINDLCFYCINDNYNMATLAAMVKTKVENSSVTSLVVHNIDCRMAQNALECILLLQKTQVQVTARTILDSPQVCATSGQEIQHL